MLKLFGVILNGKLSKIIVCPMNIPELGNFKFDKIVAMQSYCFQVNPITPALGRSGPRVLNSSIGYEILKLRN